MKKERKLEQVVKEVLNRCVSNPAYSLVPESKFYGEEMKSEKENLYSSFLKRTKPDDLNTGVFKKSNRIEANNYIDRVERDGVFSMKTADSLLRMQAADVIELEREIEGECQLRDIINSLF